MLIVSLTGGIASGKSTTSKLFNSKHKIPIIDLDVLSRKVVEPKDSSKTLEKLIKHFGKDAIINKQDGTLDRPALGRLIFGKENEKNRKIVNGLIHSAVRKRTFWLSLRYWFKGESVIIIDTPLAVEAGLWKFCGEMLLVFCPFDQQLERMLKRDQDKGLTKEDAENRLASQTPLEQKIPYADTVLDNSDNAKQTLEEQVNEIVKRWKAERQSGLGRIKTILQFIIPPIGITMALFAVWSRTRRVKKRLNEQKTQ